MWIRIRTDTHYGFILVGWIWTRIGNTDPDPDPGGPKWPRNWRKFKFWRSRCSLLRDEYFSCSLDVLYGGLGISIYSIFDQKNIKSFSAVNFFLFLVTSTLDPDPDLNWQKILVPQHCVAFTFSLLEFFHSFLGWRCGTVPYGICTLVSLRVPDPQHWLPFKPPRKWLREYLVPGFMVWRIFTLSSLWYFFFPFLFTKVKNMWNANRYIKIMKSSVSLAPAILIGVDGAPARVNMSFGKRLSLMFSIV